MVQVLNPRLTRLVYVCHVMSRSAITRAPSAGAQRSGRPRLGGAVVHVCSALAAPCQPEQRHSSAYQQQVAYLADTTCVRLVNLQQCPRTFGALVAP